MTVPFLIAIVDVSVPCGSKANINLAEFMWENTSIFAFKMYGIVCVPLDTPTVLNVHHHWATSGGWTPIPYAESVRRNINIYSDRS